MGGGASEQVRWSEGGKDTSELGGNVKRDSKYTDSKFEFARRSDSGYQRSSSRTNGNNSEHDKSRRNESAESALHDYNEYNHNEYKNIPGWEWEEGEQEEEAAEAEFEAVARLWEEMEASGKVHPLSAPVGGLRWKQEAQERFPDLARTAGVFPYMGDVIEREELDTPYSCRLARTAGVFPYMGDVIEREELDTPYDYAPPPEIDSEALAMIDRLQDLLTALRLFLPHALSTPLPAPPVTSKKEGGEGKGQGDWEQQEEGQKEEEWENERIHEDKPLRQRQQQQQQQPQEQQQQQRQERQEQQEQQSRARREEPVDIFALGLVEEGVRVQNPVVCVWGQDRCPFLIHGAHSLSMVPIPYPGMGLSDWWKRNLPEHEAEIRRNLPEEEGQDERGGVGRNGKLGAEKGKDEWRRGDEEEEEEEQSRINGGSSSSGGGKGIGTGRTAAPAGQPGSAASAPAGSPLASAASAGRASGPGSDQAGSERRGWNLLFGGGGEERGGQGAGGRGGGAAAEAESKGESGGGWLSRFQTFLRLGKGGAGKAGEPKRLTHAEGLTGARGRGGRGSGREGEWEGGGVGGRGSGREGEWEGGGVGGRGSESGGWGVGMGELGDGRMEKAEFANQLKRARQFGQLTTFGKSLPKGGQSVVTNSLRKQEVITLALAAYAAEAKLAGERLSIPFSVRQRVASETGSTMGEIDMLLAKYEWFAEAANRMQALQDQGKPLPRSFAEIEQMMGGPWSPPKTGARSGASAGLAGGAGSAAAAPARNNPCPCGSGKKYKRCCGAGTK
ncbi:unnamed protein product [Closterium sp. NIES-64]|nr:unnamed protein product [Closterium sp. NIES-64]